MKRAIVTVLIFAKLNTRRFFRDRLAIFFGILFPLIFLFVFGSISGGNSEISFRVALINQSDSEFSQQFSQQITDNKLFKVDDEASNLTTAKDKMLRSQIDATILLPEDFGAVTEGGNPSGQAVVLYTQNNASAGQTLTSALQSQFEEVNAQFVDVSAPFSATGEQLNERSLTAFDYVFAGLLGFSIIGLGIFGPVNVFPELKKQGILRRLHTTPLKVWQYFLSTVISQAIIGLVSIAVMFAAAIIIFDLNVVGNYLEITLFMILSIIMILGIGLAIGGWAKNERQAAPLSNIIVFPMMFLSGTFFPRFAMPEWLQRISDFLPLTPVIDGLRLLTTEGQHLINIAPQIGVVGGWLVIVYIIAFKVFRWE